MYNGGIGATGTGAILPATGGFSFWWLLAGFALITLGVALIRMGRTMASHKDES